MKKNIFKNIFGAISCVSLALGGLVILASCDEETDTTHTHEFSGAYLSDSTGHWQVCSCGEKGEVSAHTFGQYTVVKAATEDAAGTEERTCSVCSYLDSKEIAKLAHTHTFGSWSVKTTPTATTKGELERVCSKDKTHTETFELPVLNETDYTVTTVDATCTAKGSKTYKYTKDEEVLTVATVDIDALGHSYGNYVETTKPTTTSKGLLTRTCSRCSAEDTLELPILNTNDYTYTVTKEATYKDKGSATYSIDVEGKTYTYVVELETNGVAKYTLAEFNALESIDDRITTIYLDFGNQSLASGDVVIGSTTLRDYYAERGVNTKQDKINGEYVTETNISAGSILDSGEKVTGVNGGVYSITSQKHGAHIIITGNISGNKDGESVNDNNGVYALVLQLPGSCTFTFDQFVVNGYFRIVGNFAHATADGYEKIEFINSTFNGILQQNGGPSTNNFIFDNCTFNNYVNTASANNSNPIWIQNPGKLNFVMNNCTVNSSRPIKIVEGTVTGNYTFTNNTFDVSFENTGDEDGEFKHMAIAFESSTALGNVLVSGNTLLGGTSLISFRRSGSEGTYTTSIVMKENATFTVINNTICDGSNLSSPWKENEAWMPDFVITTVKTEE